MGDFRMMQDIMNQPASLRAVLARQSREGRDTLDRVGSVLQCGLRIVVTGMGASLHAGGLLDYHLRTRGLPSVAVDAGELLHFGGSATRDAVVVLISRSGETVEALKLLPKLREGGSVIVGVTNTPGSTLAEHADFPILMNAGPDEAVAVQSYSATALIMLLLGALVLGHDPWDEAAEAIEAAQQRIENGKDSSDQWSAFLSGAGIVYLIGRGPSLASAHEAGLLFNECAKIPSVAMPSGAFRHGPVEVVEDSFRTVLFSSDPGTQLLDDALRDRIEQMGGRVWMIREAGWFAPLLEVIPVQFAVYRAALDRRHVPGRFRYITQVTRSETDFADQNGQ